MTTQQLTLLSGPWRRPYDRRETPLWLAAVASPLAWFAQLAGLWSGAALAIALLAGLVAVAHLRGLRITGDRSRQRAWFLAQTGATLSMVATTLIVLALLLGG